MEIGSWKTNLLKYKCSVKVTIEITKKYKITKKNHDLSKKDDKKIK